ncbi:MAG: GDYXXLXY domain-containing protein [Candidatus Woesearchaeota archaeon]
MAKKSRKQNKEKLARLVLGLGLILVILVVFITVLSWPLLTGTTIELATYPVDPFDPLRGQYMIINYEINNIHHQFVPGQTIYVMLEPDDEGIWRYVEASLSKPAKGVFIKGRVTSRIVEYGIEQFFFERNAIVPETDITVEVKVDSNGNARLVQLLQNREPINIKYNPRKVSR